MNSTTQALPATAHQIQSQLDKAYAIRGSLIQDSISLARDALTASREINDKACIARSLSVLSLCLMITGEYQESMAAAEESINLYEDLGDDLGIANAKYNIAGIYYKSDNPNIGLVFLKECLETYEKFEDHHNISRVYKSMGSIFEYFGDQKSAIYTYEQAIEAGIAAGDPNLESNAYNPLSGIHLNNGQTQTAMEMIQKSIELKHTTGDRRGLGFALYGRGKVYAALQQYDAAEEDFLEAQIIHQEAKDPLGIGMVLNKLAELYVATNQLEKAEEIIQENLQKSNEGATIKLLSFKSYYLLYKIAKKKNDPAEALRNLEKHYQEKDSVINSRTLKVIESYEAIHKMQGLEHEAKTQKQKAEIIQKKNLELDSFFYRISHDLKVPINALKRLKFLLMEEVEGRKPNALLQEVDDEISSIEKILDELIKITRVNHLSEIKEEIDFDKLITDCINSYKYLVNYDEVKIKYQIQQGLNFKAEWALVNAILQNLLENAIKFADLRKSTPYVQIEVRKGESNTVDLIVADNGVGLSPMQQETIQDMFYRPNKHIKNPGMGLFIIYRAIENLKARIKFTSREGKGTTFEVMIPILS